MLKVPLDTIIEARGAAQAMLLVPLSIHCHILALRQNELTWYEFVVLSGLGAGT